MDAPLDALAFIARSESRVAVLSAVREAPRSRAALRELVDASRVTVDRALSAFVDRGWLVEAADGYAPTPYGAVVAAEVGRLLEELEAAGEVDTAAVLADVAFLARSERRLEVLSAVCAAPRTRDELRGTAEATGSTLRRILAELDGRGWITRTNHRCRPTDRGTHVERAVTRCLANLAAADALAEVLGWLPVEAFDFELARLSDARVVAADREDPTASIHRVAELVRGADAVRIAGPGAAREVLAAVRTLTAERGGTFEGVLDAPSVAVACDDPTLRGHVRAILDSGRASLARREDLPPVAVTVVDDAVLLCGDDGGGAAHQAVETVDAAVRAWAHGYVDSALAGARPLDAGALTP